MSTDRTLSLTRFSMLLAIEAIVSFTPLGSLPALGPIVATLGMIPVVATAILMGTKAGTAMGAIAGLFSFLVWSFIPPSPMAFVFTPFYSVGSLSGNFWSLVICFVPRVLTGTVTGVCFCLLSSRFPDKNMFVYSLSGALGSLTNTFLVLGGIYVFFGADYADFIGLAYNLLLGAIGMTVLTNGIPEAVISAVVAFAICRPLRNMTRREMYG